MSVYSKTYKRKPNGTNKPAGIKTTALEKLFDISLK